MSLEVISNRIEYIQQKDEFDYLKSLIDSLEKGRCAGILLYGPPGSGKTLLATSLASAFNAPYYIIDGSSDLDRRDIEGFWEFNKGETRFNYGPLTLAIKDANNNAISFVIINEINAIRECEQISLNSLLSENHINLISRGFERHELNSQSKLIIIGTMNKGVIGISKLQEAFEDRFIVCPEINYPEKQKEIHIATEISGCDKRIAEVVVDAARQIRKQALKDFSISKIFSTRLIINFCLLISKMPLKFIKQNIENVIINKLGENQEEKKSIAMILDGKMFESKLRGILTNTEIIEVQSPNLSPNYQESFAIENMKKSVDNYINKFGRSNAFKENGVFKWKIFEYFWRNRRNILQNYFKLTEKADLHKDYKQNTGNNYIYRNSITLKYIKWLFQQKQNELYIFMKQICPII